MTHLQNPEYITSTNSNLCQQPEKDQKSNVMRPSPQLSPTLYEEWVTYASNKTISTILFQIGRAISGICGDDSLTVTQRNYII